MSSSSRVGVWKLDCSPNNLTRLAVLEITKALLDLVLETQAWASVCPAREHDKTGELLEKEINFIIETEKAQGRSSLHPRSCVGTRYIVQTTPPRLLVLCYAY